MSRKLSRYEFKKLVESFLFEAEEKYKMSPEEEEKFIAFTKNSTGKFTNDDGDRKTFYKVAWNRAEGRNQEEIKLVQSFLKAAGYYDGPVDGFAIKNNKPNKEWEKALKDFQRDHTADKGSSKVDGVVGPKTARTMLKVAQQYNYFDHGSLKSKSYKQQKDDPKHKGKDNLKDKEEFVADALEKNDIYNFTNKMAKILHKMYKSNKKIVKDKKDIHKQLALKARMKPNEADKSEFIYRDYDVSVIKEKGPFNNRVIIKLDKKDPEQLQAGKAFSVSYDLGKKDEAELIKSAKHQVNESIKYGLSRGSLLRERYRRY